jgi:hypothetical protein
MILLSGKIIGGLPQMLYQFPVIGGFNDIDLESQFAGGIYQ